MIGVYAAGIVRDVLYFGCFVTVQLSSKITFTRVWNACLGCMQDVIPMQFLAGLLL